MSATQKTQLQSFSSSSSTDELLAAISRDGAAIVEGLLTPAEIDQFRQELDPYMNATEDGADNFSGRSTTRTGALVARSAKARDMVTHPAVLAAANQFLDPYCERIQLHLSQIIRLRPGQGKQEIHRDRWAWGKYLQNVEPQFNTI